MALMPPIVVIAQEIVPEGAALMSGVVMGLAWAAGSVLVLGTGALGDAFGPRTAALASTPVMLLAATLAAQRGLAGHRRDAIRGEHLGAQDFGRQVAHAALRAVGQLVADADVPGVAQADVPDVDDELPPLAKVQGRGAGLVDHEVGSGNRQWRRDAVLAGQRFVEHAVDQPAEVPAGPVDERQAVEIGRIIVEHHGQLDDDLFSRRDDGPERAELPGQASADVAERVVRALDERRAAAFPVDRVADVRELRGRFVEVVDDRDPVQIVERALVADDRAGQRIPHHRHLQGVGEGHADRRRGLTGRRLLVDLLHRDEERPALRLQVGGDRAVREPEPVIVDMIVVARHLTGEVDVVEDDQVALRVRVARIRVEVGVRVERVGLRVVLHAAVLVDVQLDRIRRAGETVEEAAGVVGAVVRARGEDRAQQQHAAEQPGGRPAALPNPSLSAACSHRCPRSSNRTIRSRAEPRQPVPWTGLRRSRCRGAMGPLDR